MVLWSHTPSAWVHTSRSLSWMGSRSNGWLLHSSRTLPPQTKRSLHKSIITMMPEGPEVRTLVDQLAGGGVGQRLVDIKFLSGRYVKHGPPDGYAAWRSTRVESKGGTIPSTLEGAIHRETTDPLPSPVDTVNDAMEGGLITDWNCKGKFMYIVLDGNVSSTRHDVDHQHSVWITLGMTGQFLSERAHQEVKALGKSDYVRWYMELVKHTGSTVAAPPRTTKIYYADSRGFGTVKFTSSRQELIDKLASLGPDMLTTCTEQDFLHVVASQRNPHQKNVCKFLMDQGNVCGIGNYILAEGLYRANVDPFATLSELDESTQRVLFRELQAVTRESYQSQTPIVDHDTNNATSPQPFEYQCYGQERCKRRGSRVYKETNGPHGRTIWYTNEQLLMPREQRTATNGPSDNTIGVITAPLPTRAPNSRGMPTPETSDTMSAVRKKKSNLAAASTPGNAKLAALLTMTPIDSEALHQASTNVRSNLVSASTPTDTKVASLLSTEVNSPTEEPLVLVEEFANHGTLTEANPGPRRGSSTAAAALTPGNAKLAALLAAKGNKNVDFVASTTPQAGAPRTASVQRVDPAPLVAALLSGLTDPEWKSSLFAVLSQSPTFAELAMFLKEERDRGETIYPPAKEIFAALNLCPLDSVKVVIVGQDPYHGAGQGHGLAFSVRRGVRPPPSLVNILKEVIEDVGIDEPRHGNLECWARQGVLLMNTVLTVREGNAFSHANKGWEHVTDAIIRIVSERHQRPDGCGLVFLLWGNAAAQKVGLAVDNTVHKTIQTSHPSPLGATKTKFPFIGSRCFSRTNKLLMAMGHDPVNWSVE